MENLSIFNDALRLKQILKNLVTNSIKFTNQGGVKIKITEKNKKLIQFDIIDTGIGITNII